MSIDRCIDKEDMVHLYNGILAIKKNKIMPFAATRVQPVYIIIQTEIRQRERQVPYDINYMWNPKHDANELIYET